MYEEDIRNDSNTEDNRNTTRTNTSASELEDFRRWRDSKLTEAGIAQGRAMASAEHAAAEREADAAAIAKLASRGLTLRDTFGPLSTAKGRGVLVNIHRSGIGSRDGTYARLRRMAREESLVK